ncbi:R3H domain-containing nucleic acid-binding protein [Cyanobacterium aponinum UTEX 3222]|uniref:Single-stranded nucleic acid binding R3H domain-containing protein n=2 Tax=Cyanobacterium aponinum TaxID=379064 RepID=K9Z1S3_CYAAP|nr:R3H domain-containing nucleic acid-binding protein [Cyanobacterium aponinum]WRL40460.1 R3H domain-containing nucleic acid-binding protein [Cyanobacterium aponinum UTEX 3222]AFZ52530.1 single-stranded nucleic acid binding R3H domain-containing protein [Cyanobacterium aponinum PCC 10605]MBD2393165.1 AAA family ATPase [Cyanobacterium aponinum FACHB-4101]PHV62357.1 single-stranded DNA-binding protein [Cyanobacterium aponinum IPPAS B-1201]WPF87306.1 R3H domain-containing nucleic acid-binding pro
MELKLPPHRMQITDDLDKLLEILPSNIKQPLENHPQKNSLIEIVLDLGRKPEARFSHRTEYLSDQLITREDITHCVARVGNFSADNRAGIERTLHRISAIRNRQGDIIGLTCRIGRAVFGTILMIKELVESGQSILLLGRPGVGKTTALREIARVLADELEKRVVIIDTSNEIAGDGDVPHPAIGRARRMQVARPELQHQVMIEAVENHMPEVIIIDEIGTELEALAARTIAERGVQLVGTAHGNHLENLIKNPTLSDLIGGIQSVTLGDEEARRRGSQKTVLERKAPPTFEIAVEMWERQKWVVHEDVAQTVDYLLRGKQPIPQLRQVNDEGEVSITRDPSFSSPQQVSTNPPTLIDIPNKPTGLRAQGKMTPLPIAPHPQSIHNDFEEMLANSWYQLEKTGQKMRTPGPNGEDFPIYLYPYGIGKSHLDHVISILKLPIVLTKDLDSADAVLALRSQVKHHSKLVQLAKERQLPIKSIKSNSIPHISRALKELVSLEDGNEPESLDIRVLTRVGSDDEIEALEEARLAVEQIVIPQGQPVELLPRSAKVRKMQHELIEHYRLRSDSFGDEPNRRLRIYPA